jgi:hypothetical protein
MMNPPLRFPGPIIPASVEIQITRLATRMRFDALSQGPTEHHLPALCKKREVLANPRVVSLSVVAKILSVNGREIALKQHQQNRENEQ